MKGTLLIVAALAVCAYGHDWNVTTALDEYIAREEPFYGWEEIEHRQEEGLEIYVLNVTCCQWLDETKVDRSLWFNYLVVYVPHEIRYTESAVIWIDGGRNTGGTPGNDDMLMGFTRETGAVSAFLGQVPNQPIVFADDPEQEERTEDSLIAYTWRWFIDDPSDPEVLARFPMVKSTVKAMDAMTEFLREKEGLEITEFLSAGGSKRGWVAWLVAAVDRRIFATVPVVLSCLNFVENIHHHYMSLGGWSFAFWDYYHQNVTADIDHPNTALMMTHVDPYEYRERLTMPIMYIGATGDEFFLPDDTHYWWDSMVQGANYLYWVVNAEHTLEPYHGRIVDSMVGFFTQLKGGEEVPRMTWDYGETNTTGYIDVYTTEVPSNITGFKATTLRHIGGNRRDFRLITGSPPYVNPVVWIGNEVELVEENHYRFEAEMEDNLWVGMLIEATFDTAEGTSLTMTTEVNIIPNVFPFEQCEGPDECKGSLV